jgi:hypothetical protein
MEGMEVLIGKALYLMEPECVWMTGEEKNAERGVV